MKKKSFFTQIRLSCCARRTICSQSQCETVGHFLSRFTPQIKRGDGKTQYQYWATKLYVVASQKDLSCSLFQQWDCGPRFPAACKLSMSAFHFFIDVKRWVATVLCDSRECAWWALKKMLDLSVWEHACHAFPCAEPGGGPAKRGCGGMAWEASQGGREERFHLSPAVNRSLCC